MPAGGDIAIRLSEPADHAALAMLFVEMQAHYAVPCPPLDAIVVGLSGRPAGTELMVAERRGALIGFAAFGAVYPGPGLKPGLFMKELYVEAAARGDGAGRALMRALAREALSRGLSRIDWTADADDGRLLAFYEALGGTPQPKKLFFRLTGAALAAAAGQPAIRDQIDAMKYVSLAEMQQRLPELTDAVEAGETVVVTRDGRPILDLVPHHGAGKGINWAALETFKKERGIDRLVTYVADDFDEPLPEDFLLRPLPASR